MKTEQQRTLLEQVDKLLANIRVSGDDVMILAAARQTLGQVYRELKEEEA